MASYDGIRYSQAGQSRIQSFSFVLSVFLCALLCIGFAVSSFEVVQQSDIVELDDKVNPNEASVSSLIRLPGIGLARAEAIVDYRNNFIVGERSRAFRNCDDLQKIKGIGPKTAEDMCQWLKFE